MLLLLCVCLCVASHQTYVYLLGGGGMVVCNNFVVKFFFCSMLHVVGRSDSREFKLDD